MTENHGNKCINAETVYCFFNEKVEHYATSWSVAVKYIFLMVGFSCPSATDECVNAQQYFFRLRYSPFSQTSA